MAPRSIIRLQISALQALTADEKRYRHRDNLCVFKETHQLRKARQTMRRRWSRDCQPHWRNRSARRWLLPGVWGGSTSRWGSTSTEATVNQIILAALCCIALAFNEAGATGLVNTEAGTFRCSGTVVRLDSQGVPFTGEPGGKMKPCDQVVELRETI
jgi:hypothetical protein